MAARLIYLNGAPGSGKSTLAQRLADASPWMLVVEIDELRTRIGGWAELDETTSMARELALALIETHLNHGHDVVVPQYVGRSDFIVRLAEAATANGAAFREIVLDVEPELAIERFRARRTQLDRHGRDHPERDVADERIAAAVLEATDRLASIDLPSD